LINKNKRTTELTYTIPHPDVGIALYKYIISTIAMNKRTAPEYYFRLISFQEFVNNRYKTETKTKNETGTTLDNMIANIKAGSEDVYKILSDFVSCLQTRYSIKRAPSKRRHD
jgi:hypothetical protein